MDEPGPTIASFQTINCLPVLIPGMTETFYGCAGRATLDSLLQVDELLCVGETIVTMDGDFELLPELLPM